MVLHYNEDGSIEMKLNIRGKLIKKTFQNVKEHINFINTIII